VREAAGGAPGHRADLAHRMGSARAPPSGTWRRGPGIAVEQDGAKRAAPSGVVRVGSTPTRLHPCRCAWAMPRCGSPTSRPQTPWSRARATCKRLPTPPSPAPLGAGARRRFHRAPGRRDPNPWRTGSAWPICSATSSSTRVAPHAGVRKARHLSGPPRGAALGRHPRYDLQVKHTPVRRFPASTSPPNRSPAHHGGDVDADALTPEQKEVLEQFSPRRRMLLHWAARLEGFKPAGGQITLDKAELERLTNLARREHHGRAAEHGVRCSTSLHVSNLWLSGRQTRWCTC